MAKTLTGVVTSDAANKTITVTVTSRETHQLYGKQYTLTRKYMAHDEDNIAKKGDKVIISAVRKVSKRKAFKLDSVIEKARGTIELKEESQVPQTHPPKLSVKTDNILKDAKEKVLEG